MRRWGFSISPRICARGASMWRSTIPLSGRAKICCVCSNASAPRGGPEPPNYPDEYLEAGADASVTGEGEVSLEALLRAFAGSGNLACVPGIHYRDGNGSVARTAAAPLIPNMVAPRGRGGE